MAYNMRINSKEPPSAFENSLRENLRHGETNDQHDSTQ